MTTRRAKRDKICSMLSATAAKRSRGLGLDALPTEILASVFALLDYDHVARTACVSTKFRGLVLPRDRNESAVQEFWRSLCKMSFRMDEERFREWTSVGCWYDIYHILNSWVKREGFYTLSQAAPWGSLCLFHLEAGKLVGELLTPRFFAEHSARLRGSGRDGLRSDGLFDREVFFEAEFRGGSVFGESGAFCGDHACQIMLEDALGRDRRSVGVLSMVDDASRFPFQMTCRPGRPENLVIFDPASPPTLARRELDSSDFRNLDILKSLSVLVRDKFLHNDTPWEERFEVLVTNGRVGPSSAEDAKAMFQLWMARDSSNVSILGTDILRKMWEALDIEELRSDLKVPRMLNFEYVDGPSHELSGKINISDSMPVIKSGLYCGSYHPELYLKYHKEILLVEYRRYADVDVDTTWEMIHAEVFNSQDASEMLALIRGTVQAQNVTEAIFVVGRKVTGDRHVPAGKATFGALVHPILPNPSPDFPETTHVTSSGEDQSVLQVIRRWYGWGTVAYPVFRNPRTVSGTLTQLENDEEGNHRFGFIWDGSSSQTTVLQWLPVQDRYPWFHK